jgi:hypothetical protein
MAPLPEMKMSRASERYRIAEKLIPFEKWAEAIYFNSANSV